MFEQIIVEQVRQKKELQFLGKDFIIAQYAEMIRLNKSLRNKIESFTQEQFIKSKDCKQIVKDIRASARKIYGIFQPTKELVLRDKLKTVKFDDEKVKDILSSHLSTKERLDDYDHFFADLEKEFGAPKSILDLACGLNPVAYYHYTGNVKTTYVANELSDVECEHLQAFFDNNKINGTAASFDCVKEFEKIPAQSFDWCFLLKALDTFEYQKKYVTYDILKQISAKLIIASFPIQNIKGIGMQRTAQINWFEKMLARGEYSFTTTLLSGEVVYLVTK